MRRLSLALSLILLTFVVAACATEAPGWTYAPPTAPPASQPAASDGASAAPSEAPSAAPSSGTPSDAAGGGGGAGGSTVIQLSAQNVAYDLSEISAPADAGFTIHFDNKDAGIPHNVAIKDASGAEVFKGDIITGPAQADYQVPALPAGTYTFICSVHPNMTGTLTVGS
jgi:plastocyanin